MDATVYHNPACSKSRKTLELFQSEGIEPEIIEYLKIPPDKAALHRILQLLDCARREMMRTSETVYQANGLDDASLAEDQLLDAMITNPILIQRPIVIIDGKATIGRPPEKVLARILHKGLGFRGKLAKQMGRSSAVAIASYGPRGIGAYAQPDFS